MPSEFSQHNSYSVRIISVKLENNQEKSSLIDSNVIVVDKNELILTKKLDREIVSSINLEITTQELGFYFYNYTLLYLFSTSKNYII